MKRRKRGLIWLSVVLVLVTAAVLWLLSYRESFGFLSADESEDTYQQGTSEEADAAEEAADTEADEEDEAAEADAEEDEDSEAEAEDDEPESEPLDEEEQKVEAFDNLTDKWMEPVKGGVSMKDVENFSRTFRAVPKDRQDECVHRALNLIPDENVMLLAGILMDKSMDKDIIETVFNDVLNRDEDVKKPIMEIIFKDKAHPCWADTAWILDVTGELPNKKEQAK